MLTPVAPRGDTAGVTRADAEERATFGRRAIVGATLAPLSFAALWLAPLPLEPAAHRVVAIFAAVSIAWVFATGRVPQSSMMRAGLWLDLACLVIVVVILRIVCPLMGWV